VSRYVDKPCNTCTETCQHLWCPHCYKANYFSSCGYDEGDQIPWAECQEVFQHRQCDAFDSANYWKDANYDKTQGIECCTCQETITPIESNDELEKNFNKEKAE
jgi:hypothetical protein